MHCEKRRDSFWVPIGIDQRLDRDFEISGGVFVGAHENAFPYKEIQIVATVPHDRFPFCKTSADGINDPKTLPFEPVNLDNSKIT